MSESPTAVEGEERVLTPPRSLKENLEYRHFIRQWAIKSKANREWLMERCRNDFIFFLETFCWIYEPRPESGRPEVIPFIPWTHQRPAIEEILLHLGYRDIGLEKARGEGASWVCLMIILWRWLFWDMQAFGLVSRNELAADNPEDPDSLGWKIDWQMSKLPLWMVGKKNVDYTRNVSKHTWINKRNGSAITAYPATGDLASGGRKTAFFMDELSKFPRGPDEEAMSATEPVTNCRLLVSTPAGAEGAYYRCMTEASSMVKIVLDWTKNPTRNKDLFRLDVSMRILTRPDGTEMSGAFHKWFFSPDVVGVLNRRGFDMTNKTKLWSPWYVERCLRPQMTPKKIAQEYDRDYGGSSSRFFPSGIIELLIERSRKPTTQGEIVVNYDKQEVVGFTQMREGRCKLWVGLVGHRPPPGDYVVGCDISTGHGGTMSSASTIIVVNRKTGTKVFEYANPVIKPEALAILAVAVCKWFKSVAKGDAYLIWEGNGPGGAFRNALWETTFRNVYYRRPHKSPNAKDTKEPGWWSGKEQKRDLLSKYRHALIEGTFDNPSDYALRECLCYVEDTGGKLTFVSGHNDEEDPANTGENHGDRVIADALCNFAMEELNGGASLVKGEVKKVSVKAPEGSFLWRREQFKASQGKGDKDW